MKFICCSLVGLQNQNYEARLSDLENELRREKENHSVELYSLRKENEQLKIVVDDQMTAYRDLMNVKIQLNTEIATYRKLLESEETR